MSEIGKLFIQGCKDHLPAQRALRKLGAEGEDWDRVICRVDLDLYGDVDVRIVSSSLDMKDSQLKKKAKVDTLTAIAINPALVTQVNPKWLVSEMLKTGGEMDDSEVDIALETKNYGDMVEVARAHEAIQAIQHGEKPHQFYGATTLFLQIIYDFAVNNRSSLGEAKFNQMMDFLMGHASIVQDNMVRKARIDAAAAAKSTTPTSAAPSPTSSQPPTPSSPIAPNTAATIAQVANQQMP